MKLRILIGLKKKILDPQGRAVLHALETMGYKNVADVRIGKVVEMDVSADRKTVLEAQAKEMCEKLLTNPVIEQYRVEVLED